MHACVHTYMHACIHTYMHTYIHTYIHAYIHTYVHTYIHTYLRSNKADHTPAHTDTNAYSHTPKAAGEGRKRYLNPTPYTLNPTPSYTLLHPPTPSYTLYPTNACTLYTPHSTPYKCDLRSCGGRSCCSSSRTGRLHNANAMSCCAAHTHGADASGGCARVRESVSTRKCECSARRWNGSRCTTDLGQRQHTVPSHQRRHAATHSHSALDRKDGDSKTSRQGVRGARRGRDSQGRGGCWRRCPRRRAGRPASGRLRCPCRWVQGSPARATDGWLHQPAARGAGDGGRRCAARRSRGGAARRGGGENLGGVHRSLDAQRLEHPEEGKHPACARGRRQCDTAQRRGPGKGAGGGKRSAAPTHTHITFPSARRTALLSRPRARHRPHLALMPV